jgi:hypothetical protein
MFHNNEKSGIETEQFNQSPECGLSIGGQIIGIEQNNAFETDTRIRL